MLAAAPARLRVLLVLGRVSNLPTVWSNCLAAWTLGGGGSWRRLFELSAAASLLYVGGMFLNDAFDVPFDLRYRPERPIVAGRISARAVWGFGAAWLIVGWVFLVPLGTAPAGLGLGLLATIVTYDAVHKKTAWAPLLMAGCRFLLYLVASGAASHRTLTPALWPAVALAAYIIGLSALARGESTGAPGLRWPILLLLAPLGLAFGTQQASTKAMWPAAVACAAWILWSMYPMLRPGSSGRGRTLPADSPPGLFGRAAARMPFFFSRGVAGLLAGIVLVDWLAAAKGEGALGGMFAGLFLLALLLQRAAPAT